MGLDISPIGNHKLNTKNIKVLAEDITSRIDVNIEYGFYGKKEHFKLLGENRESEDIVLGKIVKDEKFKTFKLIDEHYHLKQLYEKFGENLFHNPDYWINHSKIPENERIEEEKKGLIFPYFEMDLMSSEDSEYL